jgi:hypothetical protein
MGPGQVGAYLRAMTTYTTPHFATGVSDRNLRSEPTVNRARPAVAATYRTAGVTNESALMADGQTPDWQPGAAKGGVPKVAIGALGAALVGGIALAIVLLAPSHKVTKQVMPDPIAQAAANTSTQKSNDATEAAVNDIDKQAPAAGNAAAATSQQAAPAVTGAPAVAAIPAPVQAVIPNAPPVVNAPVAHLPKVKAAPVLTPRIAPQPVPDAPAVQPDVPAQSVTQPANVQPPAMQQTPDAPTVTPSIPAPTPDTPAPIPVPAPAQ